MDGLLLATKAGTLDAIKRAFEGMGIEFTDGNAPGVRLKPRSS
jgi:hypothetical protein